LLIFALLPFFSPSHLLPHFHYILPSSASLPPLLLPLLPLLTPHSLFVGSLRHRRLALQLDEEAKGSSTAEYRQSAQAGTAGTHWDAPAAQAPRQQCKDSCTEWLLQPTGK